MRGRACGQKMQSTTEGGAGALLLYERGCREAVSCSEGKASDLLRRRMWDRPLVACWIKSVLARAPSRAASAIDARAVSSDRDRDGDGDGDLGSWTSRMSWTCWACWACWTCWPSRRFTQRWLLCTPKATSQLQRQLQLQQRGPQARPTRSPVATASSASKPRMR